MGYLGRRPAVADFADVYVDSVRSYLEARQQSF